MTSNINNNAQSAKTQCAMILEWMQQGNTITSLEALKRFGCMRLASRVCDLRDRGVSILTQKIKTNNGKWVTEYRLAPTTH